MDNNEHSTNLAEVGTDYISRQAAIDAFKPYADYESNRTNADWVRRIELVLHDLPPAQPEKRTQERTETHACDCIERQAAIDAMSEAYEKDEIWEDYEKRLNELPSAQPDLSGYSDRLWETAYNRGYERCRQDAIDALAKFVPYAICDESTESYTNGLTDAYNLILQLPSAQPEVLACGEGELTAQPEIIQCKDCKHKGTKNCVANAWTTIFGVMVKDDFYCGLAERRTDERTG